MKSERWRRIIPVAFVMYTIAFVDRTNISLGLPAISRDLHMNPEQAGNVSGVFFWGYLLLQIPGGYLAERWSAKRFVNILLVLWGVGAVACGLVHTYHQLWVTRLLLGVAEGGVWPAVLILLSHWFPRTERARANAYWMLCLPAAVIVSSPISGWILGIWGWRAMLIAEGALPFLWLIIWNAFINDHPHEAGWISREERDHLEVTLKEEAAGFASAPRPPVLRTLVRPPVLLMVAIYFLLNCGGYGYLFWLPSALGAARHLSSFVVGVLNAVPYVVTAVGMVILSKHSDRKHERRGHVAAALAWSGVFLLVSILLSARSPLWSFAAIAVVGAGFFGALGPFWAIPTETLPASVSGSAMGMINALGNLGGFFGPLAVGYLQKVTGDFRYGFAALGGGLLLAAGLACFAPRSAGATAHAGAVSASTPGNG